MRLPQMRWRLIIAIVFGTCWIVGLAGPLLSRVFYRPTFAERAARLRQDSAQWSQLAAEHPEHAKTYRKAAEQANKDAEALERKASPSAGR